MPAFGDDWSARTTDEQGPKEFEHHVATYGPHTQFGYEDFVEQFRAPQFDPAAWAATFHRAGAQFVVPVAEHHDGFAMHATDRSDGNTAVRGPGRDVAGELGDAVRASGTVLGASSHRAEHWWFVNGGTEFDSDVRDPANAVFHGPAMRQETAPDEQFLEDWLLRTVELVDEHRPQVVWFDRWIETPAFAPYLELFAACCCNAAARECTARDVRFTTRTDSAGTHLHAVPPGPVDGGVLRIRSWGTGAGLPGDDDDLTALGGSVVRVTLRPQEVQKAHDGLN